jgi:hypothetical protein
MIAEPVNIVVLAPGDNVGVAVVDIAPGQFAVSRDGPRVRASAPIPQGHKIALSAIPENAIVRRLDFPIGEAKAAIAPGDHVHIHNVRSRYLNNDEDHYE